MGILFAILVGLTAGGLIHLLTRGLRRPKPLLLLTGVLGALAAQLVSGAAGWGRTGSLVAAAAGALVLLFALGVLRFALEAGHKG